MANRIDIFQPYARPVTAPTYDFMPVKHAIFINIYTSSILRVYFNILFHACQGFLSDFVRIFTIRIRFFRSIPHYFSNIFLKNRIFENFYELFKRNEKSRNGCDFLTQKPIITAAVTVINRSAPRKNPGTGLLRKRQPPRPNGRSGCNRSVKNQTYLGSSSFVIPFCLLR